MEAVCDAMYRAIHTKLLSSNYFHLQVTALASLAHLTGSQMCNRGISGRTTSTVATRFKTQCLNISQIFPVNVIKMHPTFYS